MSCNNAVFLELINHLLCELAENANISTRHTFVQCVHVGAIRLVWFDVDQNII